MVNKALEAGAIATPRTDAEEVHASEIFTGKEAGLYWVRAEFAQQLERETVALRAQIEMQIEAYDRLKNGGQVPELH